eukprot:GHVH01005317.1.p1 GENE.GHVH01005317.1~~GHVH01005317.1.p1  ORF type:complete len:2193 (+),score=301.86 GHVH01005317.1:191-6769(+)
MIIFFGTLSLSSDSTTEDLFTTPEFRNDSIEKLSKFGAVVGQYETPLTSTTMSSAIPHIRGDSLVPTAAHKPQYVTMDSGINMSNREAFNERADLADLKVDTGRFYRRCGNTRFGPRDDSSIGGDCLDSNWSARLDKEYIHAQPTAQPDGQVAERSPRINSYYHAEAVAEADGTMYDLGGIPFDYRMTKQKMPKHLQGFMTQFFSDYAWNNLMDNRIDEDDQALRDHFQQFYVPNQWFNNVDWSQYQQRPNVIPTNIQKFRLRGENDDGTLTSMRLWPYGAGSQAQYGMQLDPHLPGGTRGDVKTDKEDTIGRLEAFETFIPQNRYIGNNLRTMHDNIMDAERGEPMFINGQMIKAGRGPQMWTYNELKENREARHRHHYKPAEMFAPTSKPATTDSSGNFDYWRLDDIELQEPKIDQIDYQQVQLDKFDPSQVRARNLPPIKDSSLNEMLVKQWSVHWKHLGRYLGPTFSQIGNCSRKLAMCSMEGYVPNARDYYMMTADSRGRHQKLYLLDNAPLRDWEDPSSGIHRRSSMQGIRQLLLRDYEKHGKTTTSNSNRFIGMGYDPYLDRLVGLQSGSKWEDPWGWIGQTDINQKNEKVVIISGGNYDRVEYEVNWDLWTTDRFVPMSQATVLEDRWACYMDWQMALPEIKKPFYTPKICKTAWDYNNTGLKFVPDGNLATKRGFTKFLNLTDVTDVIRQRQANQPTIVPHESYDMQQFERKGGTPEYDLSNRKLSNRIAARWRGYAWYVPDDWRKKYPYYQYEGQRDGVGFWQGLGKDGYYPGRNKYGENGNLRKFRLSEITMDWRRLGSEVDENYQWAPNVNDAWGPSGNFSLLPEIPLKSDKSADGDNISGKQKRWNLMTTADLFGTTLHNASSESPGIRGHNVRFYSRENPFRGPGHFDIDNPSAPPTYFEEDRKQVNHPGYHDGEVEPDRDYTRESLLEMDLSLRVPLNPGYGHHFHWREKMENMKSDRLKDGLQDVQAMWEDAVDESGIKTGWIDWALKGQHESWWGLEPSFRYRDDFDRFKKAYEYLDVGDICPGPQDRFEFNGLVHIKDWYFASFTIMGVASDAKTNENLPPVFHDDSHPVEVLHIPRPCNPMLGEPDSGWVPERIWPFLDYFVGNALELDLSQNYPTFLLRFQTTELWNASTYDSLDFDYTWSPQGVVPMGWLGRGSQDIYSNNNSYASRDWPDQWFNIDMPDMARQPASCILKPWFPDVNFPERTVEGTDIRAVHMLAEDFIVCHDRFTGNLWRFNWFRAWMGDMEISGPEWKGTSDNISNPWRDYQILGANFDMHFLDEYDPYYPLWKKWYVWPGNAGEEYELYDPMRKWSFNMPGSFQTRNYLCHFCHDLSWPTYDTRSVYFIGGVRDWARERLKEGYFHFCLQCPFAVLIGNTPAPGGNASAGGRADNVVAVPVREETNRHMYHPPYSSDSGGTSDESTKAKLRDEENRNKKMRDELKEEFDAMDEDEYSLMKSTAKFASFLQAQRFQHVLANSLNGLSLDDGDIEEMKSSLSEDPKERLTVSELEKFKRLFDMHLNDLIEAEKSSSQPPIVDEVVEAPQSLAGLRGATKPVPDSPGWVFSTTSSTTTTWPVDLGTWQDRPWMDVYCVDYFYEYEKVGGKQTEWGWNAKQAPLDQRRGDLRRTVSTTSLRWRIPRHCMPLAIRHDIWTLMGDYDDIPSQFLPRYCTNWSVVDCDAKRTNGRRNSCWVELADKCAQGTRGDQTTCAFETPCYYNWIDELIGYRHFVLDPKRIHAGDNKSFDEPPIDDSYWNGLEWKMQESMNYELWPTYDTRPANSKPSGLDAVMQSKTPSFWGNFKVDIDCKRPLPKDLDRNIIQFNAFFNNDLYPTNVPTDPIAYLHGWIQLNEYRKNDELMYFYHPTSYYSHTRQNQEMILNMNRRGFEKIVRNVPMYYGSNKFTPCVIFNEAAAVVKRDKPPAWMARWYMLFSNGLGETWDVPGLSDPNAVRGHTMKINNNVFEYGGGTADWNHADMLDDRPEVNEAGLGETIGFNVENPNRLESILAPKKLITDNLQTQHSRCFPMLDKGCYVSGGEGDIEVGPGMKCNEMDHEGTTTNGFIANLGLEKRSILFRLSADPIPDMELDSVAWGGEMWLFTYPVDTTDYPSCSQVPATLKKVHAEADEESGDIRLKEVMGTAPQVSTEDDYPSSDMPSSEYNIFSLAKEAINSLIGGK